MGVPQEQTQDELWEVVPWLTLLLWQEHNPENWGQEICVQVCVRYAEYSWADTSTVLCQGGGGASEGHGRRLICTRNTECRTLHQYSSRQQNFLLYASFLLSNDIKLYVFLSSGFRPLPFPYRIFYTKYNAKLFNYLFKRTINWYIYQFIKAIC